MKSELITRIQLKNDTEANWLTVADSFIPLVGEACVTNDGENKGKFNDTKKRTGKSTEELTHSKNPLTRKRAIFAQNAAKWNKGKKKKK